MRARYLTIAAPVALALPTMAMAQQETRASVDVTGTAGYSNNPFAVSGGDTGAGFVGLDVLPRLQLVGPQSSFAISGAVRLQQYLRRYSSNDSYSAAADYSIRPSERVTGHAQLNVSSAVIGGYDGYIPGLNVPSFPSGSTGTDVPVINPVIALPTLNDLAIYGLRDRRQFAHLGGDVSAALSARDSVTVSGYAEVSRYRRAALGDYEGYGTSLGYSRQLSDTASVGLRGSGTLFDYDGVNNNTRIYSLEGTANLRLSAIWSLGGSLGVSFVEGNQATSTRQTSLSGDLNVCRRGPLSTMCVTAARRVTATGLVGSQYVTTVGASWALKLSELENVSWNANYSNVGGNNRVLIPGQQTLANEFARFSAGYDRRLTERLSLVASANVRKLFGAQDSRPIDYGGQLGVSMRLGDPR